MLSACDVAIRLFCKSGKLIATDRVAAIPVDGGAAEGEVDCRHDAPPLHDPVDVREPMGIIHSDYVPFPVGAWSPAPTEHPSRQHHAVIGPPRLHGREVVIRIVGIQRIENRVRATRDAAKRLFERGRGNDIESLRKTLIVALFVLLSAVLFTAFVSPVHDVLVALCQHRPFAWVGFAEVFMMSWVSVTVGLSGQVLLPFFWPSDG